MERVKIVATIGPASADRSVIRELIASGLDVARLNFSHGDHQTHRLVFQTLREEAARAGRFVAILADLCGPKIRVGRFANASVILQPGATVVITTGDQVGNANRFSTSYRALPEDVRIGDPILLDDGRLELVAREISDDEVRCEVVVGGELKDCKGMNLPGTTLSTPALTDKDRRDLDFARELGVDYFALSFVRRPEDLIEAKELAGDIPVIAKIEKPEAVDRRLEIVAVADGLMVARGDLGVEAGAEKVPLIQKQLIRDASAFGKPVIVATQMLESMITSPVPTRAEVSDVANAVLDGTDAVMLSGETAVGAYPVAAVREMATIIDEVENSELFRLGREQVRLDEYTFSNATAAVAVQATEHLGLKALVVHTESGRTAELVSSYRPQTRLVALSQHERVLRKLALRWGVRPVLIDRWITDLQEGVEQVEDLLRELGLADTGDDIAITYGTREASGPGRTNALMLWRIR